MCGTSSGANIWACMQMAEKYNFPKITLDEQAQAMMLKYKWPGNVRQLKNITEQMSVLSQQRLITAETLLHYIPQDPETTQLVAMGGNGGMNLYDTLHAVTTMAMIATATVITPLLYTESLRLSLFLDFIVFTLWLFVESILSDSSIQSAV